MIRFVENQEEKRRIAETILTDLPDWFGIPESVQTYISESADMPFWAAFEAEIPLGFISMKQTSPHTAEIYVMGVRKCSHRSGIGRGLHRALEDYAKQQGYSYLQVKTVQMGHYDQYDCTNRFYVAMGFRELECFPTLWDEGNPCMVYVKYIGEGDLT